jgi:hypothetical protein
MDVSADLGADLALAGAAAAARRVLVLGAAALPAPPFTGENVDATVLGASRRRFADGGATEVLGASKTAIARGAVALLRTRGGATAAPAPAAAPPSLFSWSDVELGAVDAAGAAGFFVARDARASGVLAFRADRGASVRAPEPVRSTPQLWPGRRESRTNSDIRPT